MKKSLILPFISVLGVVGTAWAAIKAGPKVAQIKANYEQDLAAADGQLRAGSMNKREYQNDLKSCKISYYVEMGKTLLPTIGLAVGTSVSIIAHQKLTFKHIAALSSAGVLSGTKFHKYRNKVKELLGIEQDKKIVAAIAKDDWAIRPLLPTNTLEEGAVGTKELYYDTFSETYFYATPERVQQAMYHLNRNFQLMGEVPVNMFYDFLGIDKIDGGDMFIWNSCGMLEAGYEGAWIDFEFESLITDSGDKAQVIHYQIEPMAREEWGID